MANCVHHGGSKAERTPIGEYCAKCAEQIKQAQADVRAHVTPKECFVTYRGGQLGWEPITGTGCAHWVAHERSIRNGEKCALGYSVRVPDVILGTRKIDREKEKVQVNDLWRHRHPNGYDHCGLVVKVEEDKDGKQIISVRHCSSTYEQGVITSDFATYLKGKGDFYRM